jgi:predicted transcriptional regulator
MALQVADVMRKDVLCLSPGMPLTELEGWLLEERVGGAPVVEDGRLVGLVSRSDLVRRLVLESTLAASALDTVAGPAEDPARVSGRIASAVASRWQRLQVADVMIHDVVTVERDAPVEKAARLLVERHIHRLVVTERGRVVGLLSSLDLVRLLAGSEPDRRPAG